MIRNILAALRDAKGQPIFTSEITLDLVRATGTDARTIDMARAHDTVWYRLRDLMTEGMVRRHPGATVNDPVAWTLVDKDRLRT